MLRFETRRAVGSRGWYFVRAALVLLVAIWLLAAHSTYETLDQMTGSRGLAQREFVAGFCAISAGFSLLIAFLLAPIPALSAFNHRRGKHMLPLLLATGLSGRQIIWQSFAAYMIAAVSLWLYMLPFVVVVDTWWGIDPVYIATLAAVTLSSMAACVALALAFSLWSKGVLSATLGVYAVTLGWLYGTFQQVAPAVFPGWVRIANPIVAIWPNPMRSPRPAEALACAAGATLLAIALLEATAATFRRCVLAREEGRSRKGSRALAALRRATNWRPGWLPGPTLEHNPVLWRECHRARRALGLQLFWVAFFVCSAAATLIGARAYWVGDVAPPFLVGAAGYEVGIGVLALAIQAGLSWSEEKSAGREGLDLILATPLGAATITRGKWWGVGRHILLVAVFPVISSLILMLDVSGLPARTPGVLPGLARWAVVPLVLAQAVLYGAAFTSLGIMLAGRLAKPSHAVAWSAGIYLAVTLFVPTLTEMMFWHTNRRIASGIATLSPIGGPIATLMTLFSSPYFSQAQDVMPCLLGSLLLASITACGLYCWTVHRFDRWLGRIPPAAGRRSGFATGPEPAAWE
jgi:hypothetical protein